MSKLCLLSTEYLFNNKTDYSELLFLFSQAEGRMLSFAVAYANTKALRKLQMFQGAIRMPDGTPYLSEKTFRDDQSIKVFLANLKTREVTRKRG